MAERLASTLPPEARSADEALSRVFTPESVEGGLTPEEEARFREISENFDTTASEVTYAAPAPEALAPVPAPTAPAEALAPATSAPITPTPATPIVPPASPAPPAPAPRVSGAPGTGSEFKLVLVDQSKDARDFARDAADERLTNELNEGGRFRRFVKGVWKGNLARDYYRQKYIREAQSAIEASQDVLTHEVSDVDRRTNAKMATIQRFQGDYEGMVSTGPDGVGERKDVLTEDNELARGFKRIIREYAEGRIDERALAEERGRVIHAYVEAYGTDQIGEGLVRTDNLIEIAQAVKGAIEHGESIDHVISNMQIITGEARTGARTEAHYSKADKAAEWLSKRRLTALLPDAAIATATSIASGILRLGSSKAVSAAAMTLAPGVGSAIMAGIRENKRVKDERQQHSREMAMGKEFTQGHTRREQMEKTRYETVNALDLTESLRENHAAIFLDDSERAAGATKDDALQAALDALAAVEVRNRISDSEKIDLISYSDVASVNEERLQLAIARAELKVALGGELDAATRARLGLDGDASLNELIDASAVSYQETIEGDMSAKNKAFNLLRARRVAFAATAGLAVGTSLGLLSQEAMAAVDPTRAGLIEHAWGGQNHTYEGADHQTVLEGMVHGDNAGNHVAPSGEFTSTSVGEHGTLALSNDHTLVRNEDGTFNFVDPSGRATVENLPVNKDGSLSPESIRLLENKGMVVEDTHTTVDVVTHEKRSVNLDQFMENHKSETTHVHRTGWYYNGSPSPQDANLNERRLEWTGNGMTKDGGFRMNVSSMTHDGSFNENGSTDWAADAKDGTLKLAISPTSGEQANPILIDIKPDGSIDIPAGSTAAQFFGDKDGEAVFNGRYAEVVHTGDVDAQGRLEIQPLATLVGEDTVGDQTFTDTVTVHTPELHPGYKITTGGYDEIPTFTEMAPVIPVASRRAMEALRTPDAETTTRPEEDEEETTTASEPGGIDYYYNDDGMEYASSAEVRARREVTSPRILEDPEQELNPGEELSWYKKLVRKKRGDRYVDELDGMIAASPELSGIDNTLKAIVKIPVNAAGRMESENIYNLLAKAYGGQDPAALSQSMILLHVNWIDDLVSDPEKGPMIAKTRAEIARAKADFPDLKIAVIETEFKRADVASGVIGFVSNRLNDAALFAVQNAMERGDVATDHDVILIRNDADPKGVSKNYLKRYIDEFTNNDETDVFTGTTSFDNTKADRLPGFVFAANFMQSLNLLSAAREGGAHTGGANFGVRASTFAAVGATGFGEYGSGAGSDDVVIGRRIMAARRGQLVYASDGSGTRGSGFYQQWRQRRGGSSVGTTGGRSRKRKVGIRIVGARVDTDSDREEILYQRGVPIVNTWNREYGFSENGYKDRDADLNAVMSEDVLSEPDAVVERIRNDMEGSVNSMGSSAAVIDTALRFALGTTANYKLTRVPIPGSKRGRVRYALELTDSGKQYLVDRLTKDGRGRPDSYGTRKLRQMYGEAAPGERQPVARPMIRV